MPGSRQAEPTTALLSKKTNNNAFRPDCGTSAFKQILDAPKIMSMSRSIKQYNITVNAQAKQTAEGFVAKVDGNHILLEDVLFSSPSSAAMFVIGKSANGWTSWKTKDGKTLHDLEDKD